MVATYRPKTIALGIGGSRGITHNLTHDAWQFLTVVIEPGDVVHLDFGLSYMGLSSDWQKMAYVLRDGETDVPAGLKRAMASTTALQDAKEKPGEKRFVIGPGTTLVYEVEVVGIK